MYDDDSVSSNNGTFCSMVDGQTFETKNLRVGLMESKQSLKQKRKMIGMTALIFIGMSVV